jgi:tetratricopeptide (TPR) repeat protein
MKYPIVSLWLALALGGTLAAKASPVAAEDSMIMRAIVSDEGRHYLQAQDLFLQLYRLTGKSEYLVQAAKEAMMPGGDPQQLLAPLKAWVARQAKQGGDLAPVRLLVALYGKGRELALAEPLVDRWLGRSDDPEDLRLAATVKMDLGKAEEAVRYLQKAYEANGDEKTLLDEAGILAEKLHRRPEAIRLLESHLRFHPDASVAVTFKLIELYAKENELKKVQELYQRLYEKTPEKYFLEKIVKLALYNKDIAGLTRFLEKHLQGNEELLYMLYKEQNRFDKAIALAHRRYEETGRPKWLAEEAILRYEKARKEQAVTPELLQRFRKMFDRALKEGADDSLYLNYYGYTLIDHDLDIRRGLELVRRALKQQPDNAYYLDSLAWGLYKEGKCAEAAKVMERVIAEQGLKEPEIAMHWESIRRCLDADTSRTR